MNATGSDTIPLTALQPVAQHGFVLDGKPVTEMGRTELTELGKKAKEFGGLTAQVVQYMIADGGFALDTGELAAAIMQIGELYQNKGQSVVALTDPRYGDIAKRMLADEDARTDLAATLGYSSVSKANLHPAQARALNDVLKRFPKFVERLKRSIKGVKFGSGTGKEFGGGVFKDGVIEIASLEWTPAEGFARIFVHETGHATFQRALLKDVDLPGIVDSGAIVDLLARRAALEATNNAVQASSPGTVKQPHPELVAISRRLREGGALNMFNAMSDDAKAFYRAWGVLRRNGGEYMLGVDLGGGVDAAQRRKYQAGAFKEFCAETFMLKAMGDLDSHLSVLRTRTDIPSEVHTAWESVQKIQTKYGQAILDGK
jgi:hypothetical protein